MGRKRREGPWYEAFGQRVKDAIGAKGMRQVDVARAMKVSEGAVTRWCGGTAPDPHELTRLAQVLDVSLDWLLGAQAATGRPAASRAVNPRAVQRVIKRLRAMGDVADELAAAMPDEGDDEAATPARPLRSGKPTRGPGGPASKAKT